MTLDFQIVTVGNSEKSPAREPYNIGYTDLPPRQDASDHQDDETFLVGGSRKKNLYLPLASLFAGGV